MAVFIKYNVSLPSKLVASLKESVSDCDYILLQRPVFTVEETNTTVEIFNPKLKKRSLHVLHAALKDFFNQFEQYKEFIVHFVMNNSQFFDSYLSERIVARTSSSPQSTVHDQPFFISARAYFPENGNDCDTLSGVPVPVSTIFCIYLTVQ